ncbi:hypothetical protein [Enterococcus plantarum]
MKILELYPNNKLTLSDIAQKCGVCVKTVYNVAKKNNLSRK